MNLTPLISNILAFLVLVSNSCERGFDNTDLTVRQSALDRGSELCSTDETTLGLPASIVLFPVFINMAATQMVLYTDISVQSWFSDFWAKTHLDEP